MQVVGYDSGAAPDATPALLAAEDGALERLSLAPGADLAYRLGERHCAGRLTDDGHEACDEPTAPYCANHTDAWPCARCTGDCELPIENCRKDHAVYLAAFAPDRFKVGVTKTGRLQTRLREQGADRGAHVRTVPDGRIARELEAEFAREIPDRMRVPTKVRGLARAVDEGAWEAVLSDFDPIETFAFDYGLALDARPVTERIASGTVRGVKGRILVLESTGGVYAVDLRDLVGTELATGRPDRNLQSSLGNFD